MAFSLISVMLKLALFRAAKTSKTKYLKSQRTEFRAVTATKM